MRVPRMTGLPLQRSGDITIRSFMGKGYLLKG
jgi:hypothetical protein